MPSSIEELRTKYLIMAKVWLLSKMRCPGRPLLADGREFHVQPCHPENVPAPGSNGCLEYEFHLGKEAFNLTRESHIPIQAALWTAYEDPQHRMKNWSVLLSMAKWKEEQDSSELAADWHPSNKPKVGHRMRRRLSTIQKADPALLKAKARQPEKTKPEQGR